MRNKSRSHIDDGSAASLSFNVRRTQPAALWGRGGQLNGRCKYNAELLPFVGASLISCLSTATYLPLTFFTDGLSSTGPTVQQLQKEDKPFVFQLSY